MRKVEDHFRAVSPILRGGRAEARIPPRHVLRHPRPRPPGLSFGDQIRRTAARVEAYEVQRLRT